MENEFDDLNKDFNKLLFDYAEAKGDLETFRKDTERLYNTTDEDVITRELSARLTGHYLFNDSKFLENLINDNANTRTKKIVQKSRILLMIWLLGSKVQIRKSN